jgi:hypothetical protein
MTMNPCGGAQGNADGEVNRLRSDLRGGASVVVANLSPIRARPGDRST